MSSRKESPRKTRSEQRLTAARTRKTAVAPGGGATRNLGTQQTASRDTMSPGRASAQHAPVARKYSKSQIRRNQMIALLVVAAAIVGMVFAVKWALGLFEEWRVAQAAQAEAYRLRMEERTFPAPTECEPGAIAVSLEGIPPLSVTGTGLELTQEVQNIGEIACTTVISPLQIGWEIRSGNQIIFNSTRCQSQDPSTKRLLLDKAMSWSQPLSWDGKVQNADCSPSKQIAQPGTYRIVPIWNGAGTGKEQVFALQAPPPTQPTPTPASPAGASNAESAAGNTQ